MSFMLAIYPVHYTALHNCLPVCFLSHMRSCTIYTTIVFYVLLTMPPCIILYIKLTWCTIFLSMFISFLYMFQATMCRVEWIPPCIPDSYPHSVTNTKCCIDTVISPDDGHIVARNVWRKEINILSKIVHQVGFIYKITPPQISVLHASCKTVIEAVIFSKHWPVDHKLYAKPAIYI